MHPLRIHRLPRERFDAIAAEGSSQGEECRSRPSLLFVCLAAWLIAGCGGGSGGGTNSIDPPSAPGTQTGAPPSTATLTAEQRYASALSVWRDNGEGRADKLQHRPKGSCMGCHGPDFFDLARIGTDRATTLRRAQIDGASAAEALLLADAIEDLRQKYRLPTENSRSFRPFQPGGALLPGVNTQERDVAFGRQLQTLLPTLMGARIDTLAKAQRARDELLDIARGTNTAGANRSRLNLRSLPVGIPFPQWSADAFNGSGDKSQTTLNDWVNDLAHEPSTEDRAAWIALNDAYLANPSNANFWKLFAFVDRLEIYPEEHMARLSDAQRGRVKGYSDQKMRSALIGQHLLRTEQAGTTAQFLGEGAVAFNYLLQDNFGVSLSSKWSVLPQAHLWDVADVGGRSTLQASINTHASNEPVATALAELGFPAFVQESTRAPDGGSFNRWDVGNELRLSWFWLGLTLDPSMQRLGRSGATQGGEYINQTLASETYKLFIHDQFSQALKGVARTLPEVGFRQNFRLGYQPQATDFYMGYYLVQFHPGGNGVVRDSWVTPEQKVMYTAMVNNTHRMYLLLYADVLRRGTTDKIRQIDFDQITARMRTVFTTYEPQHTAADEALIQDVKVLGGF